MNIRLLLSLVLAIFVVCAMPGAVFGQDDGTAEQISGGGTIIELSALQRSDPAAIDTLLNAGMSYSEINLLREATQSLAASPVSANLTYGTDHWRTSCQIEQRANVLFSAGPGLITLIHEYSDGSESRIGQWNGGSFGLWFVLAWAQRAGTSTNEWTVLSQSWAHLWGWWCN